MLFTCKKCKQLEDDPFKLLETVFFNKKYQGVCMGIFPMLGHFGLFLNSRGTTFTTHVSNPCRYMDMDLGVIKLLINQLEKKMESSEQIKKLEDEISELKKKLD